MSALRADAKRLGLPEIAKRFWAQGEPALATPVRPLRDETPVSEMTWEQLRDTQREELPSISAQAFAELGPTTKGRSPVISLDAARSFNDDDEGTVADTIPDGHWLRTAHPELFARADDGDPQALAQVTDLYEIWGTDEELATRYGTPYTQTSPEIRLRIDWERSACQDSALTREEGLRFQTDGRVDFVSWPKTDRQTYLARKAAYVKRLMTRQGWTEPPSAAQLRSLRTKVSKEITDPRMLRNARLVLNGLIQLELDRSRLTDTDAGTSRDTMERPYVPSLGLLQFMMEAATPDPGYLPPEEFAAHKAEIRNRAFRQWQAMEEAAEAEAEPRHICRNPRQHGSRDEMWHARAPQEEIDAPVVSLGLHFAFDDDES